MDLVRVTQRYTEISKSALSALSRAAIHAVVPLPRATVPPDPAAAAHRLLGAGAWEEPWPQGVAPGRQRGGGAAETGHLPRGHVADAQGVRREEQTEDSESCGGGSGRGWALNIDLNLY